METITLTINDIAVEIDKGATILDAAKKIGIRIPTLCHHDDLCAAGNCRVCVVEQKGARTLQASCVVPAAEGMQIYTNSRKVREARKTVIELLLSEHAGECTSCYKSGNCELQGLAQEYLACGDAFIDISDKSPIDISSPSIIKDDSKCIRCLRCVRTCAELQGVSALWSTHKGNKTKVETFLNKPMHYVVCTNCGQCVNRCPTGALTERNYIEEVWRAIDDPEKHVVVQTAPAVRVGLGEALGMGSGGVVTGKMVSALKRLGFDSVLDTDFTADLTIMEEGTELLARLKSALQGRKSATFPMMTSCSPGWIKFIEHEFPSLLDNLSTCKSPQQMFGALAKTYYAEKIGVDPAKMVSVSVMPCTAKKFEANRPEMYSSGFKDVDYVLTTRELAHMIRQAGLNFADLEDGKFDSIMGESTGAAVIFGATGGVMEAALRTAYEIVTGREVPFKNLNIEPVRGMEGVKAAGIKVENVKDEWKFLEGAELKVAVAHGLVNARKVMQEAEKGMSPYHFVEIMACPGGCIGGGGQPIPTSPAIRLKRAEAIYEADEALPLRKSHENPEIAAIYREFLGEPLGHKSHELLHTHYTPRNRM
ncbi:MAG: NADP-reducing hydrogenase subunit HndC [Syntrophorhabdus sp. PtaU1.Bin002]|nr:MAG: NADP-reducing hydrogenase subunit HndC [Syntrophorhabdus sp. PtaU1.Bin002]